MAVASQSVKKRQAKATSCQIEFMVDYFVQHPHVATGKFTSMHGRDSLRGSWESLAELLNAMGKDGKTKDVKSWKSTWRDNKTAVSQKMAKIRAHMAMTGNVGGAPPRLTERDHKILSIMGMDYVQGVECPDAFPEEQPNAFESLAEGEEEILDAPPEVITVRSNSNLNYTDLELLDEAFHLSVMENTPSQEKNKSRLQTSTSRENEDQCTVTVPPERQQESWPPHKRSRTTRRNRDRLGAQLQNARSDFATLAERQIACMEQFAKAMEQMAENDRQRNNILEMHLEAQRVRDENLTELMGLVKDCVEALAKK